jgi:translation initiation factor 4G
MDSISPDGTLKTATVEEKVIRAKLAKMHPDDRVAEEADLDEKMMKLKKRMLGNIKFIGELYKKGLISSKIMHACVAELIGTTDDRGELSGFKKEQDIEDLELLCKFLQTVGGTLESKANSSQKVQIDLYFDRLKQLSKDKVIPARIRFRLEEIIALRVNGWKERREQDGPATIEEIHKKIEQEEREKLQPGGGGGQRGGPDARRGSDARGDGRGDPRSSRGPDGRDRGFSHGTGGPDRAAYGQGPGAPMDARRGTGGTNFDRGDRMGGRGGYGERGDTRGGRGAHGRGDERGYDSYRGGPGGASGPYRGGGGGGSGGGGGPHGGQGYRQQPGSGASASASAPPQAQRPGAAAPEFAVDSKLSDRMRGLIDEYLHIRDLNEVTETLKELPPAASGYLVINIIVKHIDSTRTEVLAALHDLLDKMISHLRQYAPIIEAAMYKCEPLTALYDAKMDCHDAPQRLASFVDKLIKTGLCRKNEMQRVIELSATTDNADAYGISREELIEVYNPVIAVAR